MSTTYLEDVGIQDVNITSAFWSGIQRASRDVTVPASIQTQKKLEHWYCLTWEEGHHLKPHPFWDSDIYKIIEAACYFLVKQSDDKLFAEVEEAVDMIEKGQHADGYINSYFTVHGLEQRWTNTRDMHELYCLGHLLEATVAYEKLTGSGRLLKVALKALQHVDSVFGNEAGKKQGYPGHQEIEIGLLRLYEMTHHPLPLKLAEYFIFQRGQQDENGEIFWDHEARARGADPYADMGTEHKAWYHGTRDYGYHQADCSIVHATEVKGHSVRAMYYYTAATDLVRLQASDPKAAELRAALTRLWRNMVDKKIYVTGALGSVRQWEGFGPAYNLNDLEIDGCYAETCATFALINWCQRMLRLELKSEYADVMETGLYNGFLGAVSIEGDAFYYQNVLRTVSGQPKHRSKWFGVACCPPNVAKLLGSLGSLIYSTKLEQNLVAVHLFIESELRVPGTNVIITQKTDLPWTGKVVISVKGTMGLALRIPSWAAGVYSCSMDGIVKDGYLYIEPHSDFNVTLELPVNPRKLYANPLTGKDDICIARGPLIYCIEDVDNTNVDVDNMILLDSPVEDGKSLRIAGVDNVMTVTTSARQMQSARAHGAQPLYRNRPWDFEDQVRQVVAVPYFLRANRGGDGAMRVWTRRCHATSS